VRNILVALALVALLAGTVMVFMAFDRDSHSPATRSGPSWSPWARSGRSRSRRRRSYSVAVS